VYIFIFQDNSIKQVKDNLAVGDILAVQQKLLKIIRFNKTKNIFQYLVIDNNKLVWIPVRESNVVGCHEGRFHQ